MACESFVQYLVGSLLLLTTEVIPKIFPDFNVVGHLAVHAGLGSRLPRLAIFNVANTCSFITLILALQCLHLYECLCIADLSTCD